jgi:hypothetical protein
MPEVSLKGNTTFFRIEYGLKISIYYGDKRNRGVRLFGNLEGVEAGWVKGRLGQGHALDAFGYAGQDDLGKQRRCN